MLHLAAIVAVVSSAVSALIAGPISLVIAAEHQGDSNHFHEGVKVIFQKALVLYQEDYYYCSYCVLDFPAWDLHPQTEALVKEDRSDLVLDSFLDEQGVATQDLQIGSVQPD